MTTTQTQTVPFGDYLLAAELPLDPANPEAGRFDIVHYNESGAYAAWTRHLYRTLGDAPDLPPHTYHVQHNLYVTLYTDESGQAIRVHPAWTRYILMPVAS